MNFCPSIFEHFQMVCIIGTLTMLALKKINYKASIIGILIMLALNNIYVLINLLTSIGKLVQSYRYFTSNLKCLFVKNFCLLFSRRKRGGDALVQGSVMKAVELGLFLSWCGLEPQWGSFFIFPKLIFCNLVSMYKLNCRSLPFTFVNAFKIELN